MRIERDTLGDVAVPDEALWGAQTQRAIENYPISGLREHPIFIRAFILLKKAAALANRELGAMDAAIADAIVNACDELLANEAKYRDQFRVDVFQAGAGTSFNMNVNEVIANLANPTRGTYDPVRPNDHVNMAQSTNDVVPTAIRVAALLLLPALWDALDDLAGALAERGEAFKDVIKSGRTHLQDAVPVTLGQEFNAYSEAVARATRMLVSAATELREVGIGGTAAGTGMNAPRGYRHVVIRHLNEMEPDLELMPIDDLREAMQSQLPIANVSGALRNLALELTRIANDLRLLASGPQTGLAEIILPAVQPGSSIMPGKVNPSMLECLNQVCFHVIGADTAIAFAVQAGQLELNVMMPVIAFNVLLSMQILTNATNVLADKCVKGITANREMCEYWVERSAALATALAPQIGYAKAAEISKRSVKEGVLIRELVKQEHVLPDDQLDDVLDLKKMTEIGVPGGKHGVSAGG